MRSLTTFFFVVSVGILLQTSAGQAEIYDGGTFSKDKLLSTDWSSAPEIHSTGVASQPQTLRGSGGKTMTFDQDRHAFAPVGRSLYALDQDGNCFKGNFSKTKQGVALILYSKSAVSADHCVYQSEFRREAKGFAVAARDGGVCVPVHGSLVDGENGKPDWSVTETGKAVSLKNCFDHTKAYGDQPNKLKSTEGRDVASSVESSRLGFARAVEHANSDINGGTEVNLLNEANKVAINSEGKDDSAQVTAKDSGAIMATTHEDNKQQPAPAPVEVKTPPPARFTVQLASFLNEDDAKGKVAWLKDHNLESFEAIASVNGMTRYRVCVGHYNDKKEAKNSIAAILKKSGFSEAVVQKLDGAEIVGAGGALPHAVEHAEQTLNHPDDNHLANAARAVNGFDESMKPSPEGKFTIFVSSHLKDEDAKAKLGMLKKKGIAAYETVEQQNGETRYRVLTGHFASMKDAKKALPQIAKVTGNPGVSIESTKDEGQAP